MVRAYLLSLLVRQRLALKDQFQKRYQHAWLVWEPGVWHVPSSASAQTDEATQLPDSRQPDQPAQGDALCFELAAPTLKSSLKLGRDPGNDIVINDTTVSREHLTLKPSAKGGWSLLVVDRATATHQGRELRGGEELQLKPADAMKIGNVDLTFYDPGGFLERLHVEAEKFKR